jgi:EmrB/QacA subfamily drug resistance transporter
MTPEATTGATGARTADGAHAVAVTIALAVFGVFVTYLPIAGVSVSLTRIGEATGASTSDLQWVTDAYIIPMAAMILSAGAFGDIHGRRRVFLIGMTATALGAVVAAVADTLEGASALRLLWAGQAITGAGAGLLLPTTLALIAHAVPDLRDRARHVAWWATGLVVGLAVGPLFSGVILEHAGWGWIFVPTAVFAALAAAVAALRLPESSSPEGRHLDWPGQAAATVAIAASIFGVIEGGQSGWGSASAVAGLALGAVALVAFVAVELRSSSPILRISLFRSAAFTASGVAALVALFALVGTVFLLSIYFGSGQQLSPLQIAVRLLLMNGVTALANPLAGRLLALGRPLAVLAVGLALAAASMFLLTGLDASSGFGDVAWRLVILGVADAFVLSAVAVAAIHAVPHRLAGMAAAANTVLRQYGAALGPAVLGVILTSRVAGGASLSAALHTALVVNGVLLVLAAAGCVATARGER